MKIMKPFKNPLKNNNKRGMKKTIRLSQPCFWKSVRMTLTFPKRGLGSPPRLLKFQSSIVGVKTPHLEAFLISLESYRSVDVENGLV
jgi:hypothetical protein